MLKYLNPFYWRTLWRLEHQAYQKTKSQYLRMRQDIEDIYYWMSADPKLSMVQETAHWLLLRDIARDRDKEPSEMTHPLEIHSDVSSFREYLRYRLRFTAIQDAVSKMSLTEEDHATVRDYLTLLEMQSKKEG